MSDQPRDVVFEERFVQWYVWASRYLSFDPKRCRAAAWAAATTHGTQEESVAAAQRAMSGPELEELAGKAPAELVARAEEAARLARPPHRSTLRAVGIAAAIVGTVLLVLGGVCFALAQIATPR